MLIIRPASCTLRTDLFKSRDRPETNAINIGYTHTIADDRIDAHAIDYFDACRGYFGGTFHYVIMTNGVVEIGRDPNTLSPRGRSFERRQETLFVGVVGGLNHDTGQREETITDAQQQALANLEQALADELNVPLTVLDYTIGWCANAKADAQKEADERSLEDQLDRAEQANAPLADQLR